MVWDISNRVGCAVYSGCNMPGLGKSTLFSCVYKKRGNACGWRPYGRSLAEMCTCSGKKICSGSQKSEKSGQSACAKTSGGTGRGAACHFPFTYSGVTHYGCTLMDEKKPWCRTTADSNPNPKYGFCADDCVCTHTTGGSAKGAKCHFPFTYKGVTYNTCTKKDEKKLWCRTTADSNPKPKYGFCPDDCICSRTIEGTANGAKCRFPFTYRGVTYNGCTKKDEDKLWCRTTADGDPQPKFGFCPDDCPVAR